MFQKEGTACLKTCLRVKAWYFSGLGGHVYWSELEGTVSRGRLVWGEDKQHKGARKFSVLVTLILRSCAHFYMLAVLKLYILKND